MSRRIKVGTRRSPLAIAQTNIIVQKLHEKYPDFEFELVGIKTEGDVKLDVKLDIVGGKGLFVNEIEDALLKGSIDMAVHSMKDLPAQMPDKLTIAAVSQREDPRDVLITRDGSGIGSLAEGSVVGTSSIRRELQLLNLRPDLNIKQLRGNVNTRLTKLDEGEYDAIVLAAAGLIRLGLGDRCSHYFRLDEMIPAIGQGILGIQTKKDWPYRGILEAVHSPDAWFQWEAERSFLFEMNGGCSTPIAAYAAIDGDRLRLTGLFATTFRKDGYRAVLDGYKHEAQSLGRRLADIIRKQMKEQEPEVMA